MCAIFSETSNNVDRYATFCHNKNIITEMNKYLRSKVYNSNFGDLVPCVTSNAFGININILEETRNGEILSTCTHPDSSSEPMVTLYKRGEHYSAVNTATSTPHHQSLNTVNPAPKKSMQPSSDQSSVTSRKYTKEELCAIEATPISRQVRKRIFSPKIWSPCGDVSEHVTRTCANFENLITVSHPTKWNLPVLLNSNVQS